jgi:hypothetical protein
MHRASQFSQPRWDGGNLNGRTILLHAEAGLGDSLQFVRYATLVAARGGKVIVGCQAELASLIRGVRGVQGVATPEAALPEFDVHCPLMSLPLAFSTTVETIPWDGPYFRPDANKVQHWSEKAGEGFKVGLAWKGDPRNRLDRWRSFEWKQFSRILSVPGVRYFSLQKETSADVSDKGLIDWTKELLDFADTAALVANLDLVITVDTAVAHLAGAMGKPVWLLISAAPDFRWMLDRQDTPWYPSMRLFRQIKLGNWTSIVENARSSLLAEVTKC